MAGSVRARYPALYVCPVVGAGWGDPVSPPSLLQQLISDEGGVPAISAGLCLQLHRDSHTCRSPEGPRCGPCAWSHGTQSEPPKGQEIPLPMYPLPVLHPPLLQPAPPGTLQHAQPRLPATQLPTLPSDPGGQETPAEDAPLPTLRSYFHLPQHRSTVH